MKKPLLWIVTSIISILIILLFSSGGCAQVAEETATGETVAEEAEETVAEEAEETVAEEADKPFAGMTLNIITSSDPFFSSIETLLPEFEQETGIKAKMDIRPYDGLREMEILDIKSSDPVYDLLAVDICWMGEYAEKEYTVDLEKLISQDEDVIQWDDVLPGCQKFVEWNGRIVAMPISAYHWLLDYRKDWFEEDNIDVPETWDEFLQAAEHFTNTEKETYGVTFICARGMPIAHTWSAYYASFGGKLFKDLPSDYTLLFGTEDDPAVETLEFWMSMIPYAPPGVTGYSWDESNTAFGRGNIAMYPIWGDPSCPYYEDPANSEVSGRVGYAIQPTKAGMEPVIPLGGWGIGINSNLSTEREQAAWEFLKWVTRKDVQVKYCKAGGVPIRFSTLDVEELAEALPVYSIVKDAEERDLCDVDFRPRIPIWPQIEEILGLELNRAVTGEKSPEQAIEDARNALLEVLRDEGLLIEE